MKQALKKLDIFETTETMKMNRKLMKQTVTISNQHLQCKFSFNPGSNSTFTCLIPDKTANNHASQGGVETWHCILHDKALQSRGGVGEVYTGLMLQIYAWALVVQYRIRSKSGRKVLQKPTVQLQ